MKKLLLLLALFCSIVPKMSADVIQPSTTPYDPEHVYTMMNANNWYADANTHGTQTAAEYGHFAFYQATNTDGSNIENAYYIFCVESQQWLTYTKVSSYSNQRNFITMSSSFAQDDYFYLNQRETGFYDIAPYNTSGVASKYLNWYQGANENHTTIGLWEQNLSEDLGSKFTFTEVSMTSEEIPYFTITTQKRGSWIVKEDNGVYTFTSTLNAGVSLNNTNPLHQFAFYKENGNTYLYNLGAKQFIGVSGESGSFSYDPQTPIYSMCGTSTGRDNTFILRFSSSKDDFINVIGSDGNYAIKIDDWGPGSASNNSGCDDEGNRLTITKEGTFTFSAPEAPEASEEEDLSETLAPDFGIDVLGAKIDGYNGTFSENTNANGYTYTNYRKLVSEKTVKQWTHIESESTFKEVPMVTIEATTKDQYGTADAYKLNTSVLNNNTTILTLSYAVPTIMTLTAPEGYHIVGYKFTYTTTDAILDTDYYDGEISQAAAGEFNEEVKNLDAASTEIAFGGYNIYSSSNTVTISNFYVFIRKSVFLTAERLSAFQEDAGNCWYYNYTIASKRNPNNHIYAPEGKDILDLCGEGCNKNGSVQVTASDNNQRFMLIPISAYHADSKQTKYAGCYFLYNVGHGKFVSKEGNNTLLTEYPRNAVEIIAGEGDYAGLFQLKFNKENLLNVSTGYCEADDETTSCIITNNNTSDDGNNFYLREFNTREEEDIVDTYSIQKDVWYGANADTEVKEAALAKLDELLDPAKSGVGYPSNNTSITSTKDDIKSGFGLTYFDLDYYINQYKTTTEVNMPESGEAYRIYAKYANGDKRYLYRTEGGKLRMSNAGEKPTGYAGTFILKSVSEAANGQGTYAFAHDSGEYMVYATDKEEGVGGSTTGFVSAYEQGDHDADITLITAANKTANQGGVANVAGDFFGGFLLQGYNQKNNGLYYLMGGENNSGTTTNLHRGNNSDIYYSNIRSSIFYVEVEEASYPNTVKMQKPGDGEDQNTYASIWLPFTVEIPTGMKAYAARVDEANNQLLLYDVGECLPAECGAILIGSEAKSLNLVPAVTKPEPVLNNALKGSREAKAPTEGMVTYVLNGKNKIGFYPYTKTLGAYKSYIELSSVAAAQGLRFAFGPATDIESVITEGEQDAKVYYDLSGRRVENPTKGLYIVNGKKMYIK